MSSRVGPLGASGSAASGTAASGGGGGGTTRLVASPIRLVIRNTTTVIKVSEPSAIAALRIERRRWLRSRSVLGSIIHESGSMLPDRSITRPGGTWRRADDCCTIVDG